MELQFLGEHVLRTCEKKLFAVQRKVIRTLPHHTESVIVLDDKFIVGPVESVIADKLQDLSIFVLSFVADYHVIFAVFSPPLRVSEVKLAGTGRKGIRCDHGISFVFCIVHAIAHSNTLGLILMDLSAFSLNLVNSRIDKELFSVFHFHCTSRKTSVAVISCIRRHCCRKIFPGYKVTALGMPPMHWPPNRVIRVILVKEMVLSLICAKPVRIIHPSAPGRKMKDWS